MKDLKNKYIKEKCTACKNKNLTIKESKCDIREFEYSGYLYCKCSNYSNANNEIKIKLI